MPLPPPVPPAFCNPAIEIVEKAEGQGAVARPLRGDALAKEVEKFNTTPPESNLQFDFGMVIEARNGTAVTFLGYGDRVCTFFAYSKDSWQKRSAELFGQPT
jgi:hypothetical protein